MPFKPRVFSGMQPTGSLHLGNYLGATVKWIEMQKSHECIYCVVDMHAITVWQEPAELTHNIREVTAAFIASGIDPQKHIVFNQSRVVQHADLVEGFELFHDAAHHDRRLLDRRLIHFDDLEAADERRILLEILLVLGPSRCADRFELAPRQRRL